MIKLLFATVETTTEISASEALPSYEGAFVKMAITLIAFIVGIIGTFWLMRRLSRGRFGSGSGQSIQILERKALSPKTMLYVIEVGGKQTVLAESQLEIKKLMDLESVSNAE